MPMPVKMEGSEFTVRPKTLIARDPVMDNTYELFCGLVAGCCIAVPGWPFRVRPSKPSIETYSVQVPCTTIVCGTCLFSLASVPLSDPPLLQSTVIDWSPCANAAEAIRNREITPTSLIDGTTTFEILFDMFPP